MYGGKIVNNNEKLLEQLFKTIQFLYGWNV